MIQEGSTVQWKWGEGYAAGTVKETFSREVSRTINGNKVTRKGEKEIKHCSLNRMTASAC